MREIKFRRAYFNYKDDKFEGFSYWGSDYDENGIPTGFTAPSSWSNAKGKVDQQFTGFKNKNDGDVYEGDLFRIEENDEDNTVILIVVVWVQEWAMFTTLRVEDEYQAYLTEGVDAIDETMFWTYTLEDIDSPKHYPCGNIYENPDLISQT